MRKKIYASFLIVFFFLFSFGLHAGGGGAGGLANNFTKLKLTVDENSINTDYDLNSIEPGLYEFSVENKTSEKIEFIVQDLKTNKVILKLKIKPNKIKKSGVKITKNGFRYQKLNDVWHEFSVN